LECSLISPRRSKVSVQTAGVSGAHRAGSLSGADAGSTRQADASRHLSGQRVTTDRRIRGTERTQSSQRNGAAWPRCGGKTHEERPRRSRLLGRCRDESYKDLPREWHKKTEWYRVQVWAELAQTVSSDLRGVRQCTSRGDAPSAIGSTERIGSTPTEKSSRARFVSWTQRQSAKPQQRRIHHGIQR
jgi:hypothetical protein